jgi:diacylglycerol kinase (ATP)
MTRSAVIIYNPNSGRRRDRRRSVAQMVERLQRRGVRVESRATGAPGDATRLSREASAAGVHMIVVHGGDGTVNEAMQPLVGGTTPLAVWAGGTANVLARELGLPRDLGSIADMIVTGRTRRVSVGRAGARHFLLMAGVGQDAALVYAVNPMLKRFTGQGAFWIAGLRQLLQWKPRRFQVDVEGQRYGATFAVLANAASYGGGMRLAPRASMDSGCLDLCLLDWKDRLRFVRSLPAAFSGRHLDLPGVTYVQAQHVTASGDDGVRVQVDGELIGELPMTFECVPAALSVIVP